MDAGGVISALQAVVDFGMVIYEGPIDAIIGVFLPPPPGTMTVCSNEVTIPAAAMNYDGIDGQYPQQPLGGSTPTQEALRTVVGIMPDAMTVQADPNLGEQIIIIATDGAPNEFCGGDPDAQATVVSLTNEAAAKGIKVFVVSLAGGDQALQTHLEQVAAAGGTGHPPFTPMSKDTLVEALRGILGEAISCEIVLNGSVASGSECMGFVAMNGNDLGCNSPDGWRLKDQNTIELVGAACDDLKQLPSATVNAGFPCGVFTPE